MLTIIEQKLEELKAYMDDKFEAQIDSLREVAKKICSSMLKKIETPLKNNFKRRMKKTEILESEKNILQKHVIERKRANLDLQKAIHANEKYGRRLCVRIDEVSAIEKESKVMVLGNVKNMIEEVCIVITDTVIDRAYQIRKGYTEPKTKKKS